MKKTGNHRAICILVFSDEGVILYLQHFFTAGCNENLQGAGANPDVYIIYGFIGMYIILILFFVGCNALQFLQQKVFIQLQKY